MKRLLGLLVVTGLVIGCGAEYVTDEVSSLRREVAELREQAATLLDQGAPVAESNALLAEASNLLLASYDWRMIWILPAAFAGAILVIFVSSFWDRSVDTLDDDGTNRPAVAE